MPRGDQRTSVDTTRRGSVSFPPPAPSPRDATTTKRGDHAPPGVGPGRPAVASPIQILGGAREDVNQFPIQLAKVQRPSLRPETLRRDRLLDWLHAKIHSRVVLLTAEAGYGKTTLLADFSRRTRMRTLWYRLDEQDRDWVSVMHHLVAAGRVLDGGFAPATGGLLREMGPGGPDRDAIIDTFIRELFELGIEGGVVIIDDYHVVDESAEIRHVMSRLIARAPERMTFVFAGRRHPSIPLARLRALGEVVELTAQDLRFDGFETEQLFRETYGRPLEPDVLAELGSRTEGWAASLQLVQTALGDRSSGEIRTFVRGLTGAHGDLYDYLAEEVVGEQDERMQEFLMRTSILQVVDPERVGVVAALDHDAAQGCIELAERLGLLSRHGTAAHFVHRYHPLVRDFLQDRLRREIGAAGVIELHRQVATWADGSDWRLAAYHYGAAGDLTDVHRVLTSAIQTIMSTGEYELAEGLINAYTAADRSAVYELVRSRMAWLRGDLDEVARRAASAAAQKGDVAVDLVLAIEFNSMALAFMSGQVDEALAMARELASRPIEGPLAGIPLATQLTAEVSVNRNIREYIAVLEDLLDHQRSPNSTHFFGITNLNLANAARSAGEQALSQRYVDAAIKALERSSKGHELGSAKQVRAWLLAYAGDYEESAREFVESTHTQNMLTRAEGMVEWADAEALFGDANESMRILDECSGNLDGLESYADNWRVVRALGLVRLGALEDARELLRVRPIDAWSVENAHKARKLVLLAGIETLLLGRRARAQADEALAFAIGQDAHLWARFARVVRLGTLGDADAARELRELLARDPAMVSAAAEWAVAGIHLLNSAALDQLRGEIRLRPARWRGALRATTAAEQTARAMLAAEALDEIGETEDVLLLRQLARRLKGRGVDPRLGKRLARRLANRVFVEDQGRVELRIGDTLLPGTAMRRKVLALLCFLLTRPQFSAPRDAVLDAMWPDLEPAVAVNSLNQTVYFLRRVFEDPYAEDLSPGYVHHASDVLWLDPELISSRSGKCAHILASIGEKPDPDEVRGLITAYRGRFALDFAYEPWAEAYRESLHAAYLEVAERSIRADTATGHFDRGIQVARRVIAIDPDADQLEASLLRLYRLAGAHSAAAEQYEHYAAVLRSDLGVEPPSLDDV